MPSIKPTSFLTSQDKRNSAGELAISTTANSERMFLRNANKDLVEFAPLSYIQNNINTSTKIPLVNVSPSSTITIDPYKVYNFGNVSSTITVSFNSSLEISGYVAEYTIRFTAGNGCNITLPQNCTYNGGSAPTYTSGHIYELCIHDNLVAVGEFF